MRSFRSKPVGWRGESHRHYLAAKGVKTRHKYYAYAPMYVAGDLPLIAGDALGTAGASVVPWIPVAVPLLMLYGGAKYVKKKKDKTGSYFADNEHQDEQEEMVWYPADLQAFDSEIAAAKERGDDQFTFKGKQVLVSYGKYLSEYLHGKFDEQKHFATKTDEFEAFELSKGEDITLADAYSLFAKKDPLFSERFVESAGELAKFDKHRKVRTRIKDAREENMLKENVQQEEFVEDSVLSEMDTIENQMERERLVRERELREKRIEDRQESYIRDAMNSPDVKRSFSHRAGERGRKFVSRILYGKRV